jgi:multidrug efflux pump subunit AcrA (membrane-fusion protein)
MFGLDCAHESNVAPIAVAPLPASPAVFESPAPGPVPDDSPPKSDDDLPHEDSLAVAAPAPENMLRVTGMTEPAPGRYAKLPLATSQAVAFVDVKLGDRVKKGWQVFSHWESPDRLQAVKTELERTKKLFDVAKARSTAATQTVERLKSLQGSVSAQELQDAEAMTAIRQGEMDAAQLAVSQSESHFTAMEFEFTQAFVTSPIDGIITAVDVVPGERRQLSGPFRGVTVLDTSVLYCRCLLNQEQLTALQRLAKSELLQPASDSSERAEPNLQVVIASDNQELNAVLVWVGVQADASTGLIPVLLEVKNPAEKLRCGIQVEVCFRGK